MNNRFLFYQKYLRDIISKSLNQILFEVSTNHSVKDFPFRTIYWLRLLSRSQVGEDK